MLIGWISWFFVFWVFGFWSTYSAYRFGFSENYIRVPEYVYFLCGCPGSNKFSIKKLTIKGASSQLTGYLVLIYGFTVPYLVKLPIEILNFIGVLGSMLISTMIVQVWFRSQQDN